MALVRILHCLGRRRRIVETRILRRPCRKQEKRYHCAVASEPAKMPMVALHDGLDLLLGISIIDFQSD